MPCEDENAYAQEDAYYRELRILAEAELWDGTPLWIEDLEDEYPRYGYGTYESQVTTENE